jgi:hypothetical protein
VHMHWIVTYRVDLQVPRLPRLVQINDNLIKLQPQLLQHDMRSMRPRTFMVRVQSNLRGVSIYLSHDVDLRRGSISN